MARIDLGEFESRDMLDWSKLSLFVSVAAILVFMPGPNTLYIVARSIQQGRLAGLMSSFGVQVGTMVHIVAASLGLSALLVSSAVAFNVVKYLGAAYLVYLGIQMLLRKDPAFTAEAVTSQDARRALFEGIVVEALNVKTALFFLAFLPQFTSPSAPLVPQLVLLGSTCVVLNTLVDVVAVFAAHRLLRSGAARASRARMMTRLSGVTMLGLGAILVLAQREA